MGNDRFQEREHDYRLSIFLMTGTAFFFAFIALVVKLLEDIPLMEIIFFRNFISMIVIPVIVIKQKIPIFGQNKLLLMLRGMLGAFGMIGMFYSYMKMSITDATAIHRLSPFFIIFLSILFLKEKYYFWQVPIILTAFIGALLVIKPGFRLEIFPAVIALISAILMGSAHVIIRQLRLTDNHWVIINYFAYITGFMAIILLLLQGNFVIPDLSEFLLLLLLGFIAFIAQISLTLAYKYAPASMVATYIYSQIIFAAIFEISFLKVFPDLLTLFGSSLIIISGVLNYQLNKNN